MVEEAPRRARNLRCVVAAALRSAIMAGEYAPGTPLGEHELAERFGVSRGPVREALVQLERDYLVRSYPNRGFVVVTLSEQEFDERLALRSVLEPIALGAARERATAAKLSNVRKHLRELEKIAAGGDQSAYVSQDYNLHVAIWEMSGQPLLKDLLVQITAPVFAFEGLMAERYRRAKYDLKGDARAHRILLDYLEGATDQDAECCLRPVLELAMRAERPIVFGSAQGK
jgi:DNA-binding GntR family transcriptional regulator